MKLIGALPFLFLSVLPLLCAQLNTDPAAGEATVSEKPVAEMVSKIVVGAARMDQYLHLIEGKEVALVVNQTSLINGQHLVDTLIRRGISISKIFAPEHGFRGLADAGEKLSDGRDPKTGISITSLYGSKRKPGDGDLENLDFVLFDIQDVGARFYTYISTMHYMMEACAEHNVPMMVLDRPNPNGHYIDGPVLDPAFRSFVGMHEIPVVHGLTVGELALMINAMGWLKDEIKCELTVVSCLHYDHNTTYDLPVPPSPNLPNARSVSLYPSLCFFEGTTWSIGRGTQMQFQVLGHPEAPEQDHFSFTPISGHGSKYPKHEDKTCYGYDLRQKNSKLPGQENQINLEWLTEAYEQTPDKNDFFLDNNFIDKLAGTDRLRKEIIAGKTAVEIRESWSADLMKYRKLREQYLLYKDFE